MLRRLDNIDAAAALLAVEYDPKSDKAVLVLMGKERGGWSFAGYMEHEVKAHHTTAGFEVRKVWGV